MLLSTVLAVTYGGLLVSTRSLNGGEDVVEDDAELTDNSYYLPTEDSFEVPVDFLKDDLLGWTAEYAPQQVMDSHVPYYADAEVLHPIHLPDTDIPKPKLPHGFPKPPQHPSPAPPPSEPPKRGPFPPGVPQHREVNKTIYQVLESQSHFSRIFKLVNATEEVTKLLNDSTANVTFFAAPNWAFPKHRRRSSPLPKDGVFDWEDLIRDGDDIADWFATAESLLTSNHKPNEDVLRKFLKYILLYETLPSRMTSFDLAKNATFATSLALSDGSFDGQPLRVRAGSTVTGRLYLNLFAAILKPNVPAANGLIHVTSQLVLPPPSTFQIAFLLTDLFSVLSSAVQRVGLTDDVDWRDTKDHAVVGSPAVTFFAPTNKAFSRLPSKLKLFLFSPFGQRALKKLLQFHVVPEFILHSNFFHNASTDFQAAAPYDTDFNQFYEQLNYDVQAIPEELYEDLSTTAAASSCDESFSSREDRMCKLLKESGFDDCYRSGPMPPPVSWCSSFDHDECSDWRPHSPHHPLHHRPPPHHYPPSHQEEHDPPLFHHPHFPSHGTQCRHHSPPLSFPHDDEGLHHAPPEFPHFEEGPHRAPPFPNHGQCRLPFRPAPFDHDWFDPHHAPPPHFPRPGDDCRQFRFPVEAPHFSSIPCQGPPHHPPGSPPRRHPFPFPRSSVAYSRKMTAPTLLTNHSLPVYVVQVAHTLPVPGHRITHYKTAMFANGVHVKLPDLPTRNGALHITDRLLNPLKKPKGPRHAPEGHEGSTIGGYILEEVDEDEWAGWEEWLPAWAEED